MKCNNNTSVFYVYLDCTWKRKRALCPELCTYSYYAWLHKFDQAALSSEDRSGSVRADLGRLLLSKLHGKLAQDQQNVIAVAQAGRWLLMATEATPADTRYSTAGGVRP